MARKPSARARGNKKTSVKKSLSLTPNAWKHVVAHAKLASKSDGMPPNYSSAASVLISAGAHATQLRSI